MRVINVKLKRRDSLSKIMSEYHRLKEKEINHDVLIEAKESAMKDYINGRISKWNEAIRSTNGMRRGETSQQYQARLVKANMVAS